MTNKLTKKELRQPDALQRAGLEARGWLEQNQRLVVGAVVGLVAIGAVFGLANYFSGRKQRNAGQTLGEKLEILGRPVSTTPAPAAEGDKPPFETQKAKDEALVAELGSFHSDFRSTKPGTTAALPLAFARLRLGNPDEALAAFDTYLKEAPKDDVLRAGALEGKGYAFEGKGDMEKAMAAFDELATENTSAYLAGMGLYHRARLLSASGKKDDAAKVFDEVARGFPESAAAGMAKERLAALVREGVTPPAPPAAATDAGTP